MISSPSPGCPWPILIYVTKALTNLCANANIYIQVDEKKLVKARKDFYDHAEFHAPTVDRLIFISMKRPFH